MLFTPLQLGPCTVANRVWLPAMVTWLSNDEGEVTPEIRARYVRYAQGAPGMIVLEAMGIRDIASGPLLRISHDRYVPALRELVAEMRRECAQRNGSGGGGGGGGALKIVPQIIDFLKIARRDPERSLARLAQRYPGCERWDEAQLQATLTPREWRDYAYGYRQQIEDLPVSEIEALPGHFAAAAVRAQNAGFDGVELHFAHAYTMSSLLSATNARTDHYGGSLDNRLRSPLAVIAAVRAAVGADFAVGLRMLGSDDVPGGTTIDEAAQIAVAFARAGVDFISVSRGGRFEDAARPAVGKAAYPYTGQSGLLCMPTHSFPEGYSLPLPRAIRAAVREAGFQTPIVGAGRINSAEVAEAALHAGDLDLVGMARGLLADPDWALKASGKLAEPIRACKYTNACEALDRAHLPVRCQLWWKQGMNAP